MKITLNIPDNAVPAVQAKVDKYNAGSGLPTVTIEQFLQILRDEDTARDVTAYEDALKSAMASNERLMALGVVVMAQPDKLDAVEKAVQAVLS